MSEEILHIKCVLLGETAVGKSSILTRFLSNKFQNDFISTMSAYSSMKQVYFEKSNKKITYEIWDTAGEEKFRSVTKIFYQDSKVVILIYDITRKDSFEALKNYWYIEVRDNSPKNVIIAIVGNKSDLYEYEEVTEDEGKEFANSVNAIFMQTSASNGTGINELFDMIGNEIIKPEVFEKFKRNNTIKLKNSYSNINSTGENLEKQNTNAVTKNNEINKNNEVNKNNNSGYNVKVEVVNEIKKKKKNCC